ncbi:MAG TPA: hypothetical protein VLX91_12980 [Candidatus Acidoferrales bacterium]|nr:hypothetical protein [Candidatus Acidoferrales bacterium]
MNNELSTLYSDLASVFFRYAHISGALETYMTVLEDRDLQKAFSKIVLGTETEWKQIHRFMNVKGINVKWYPELPVHSIIGEKESLFNFLYGVTLSRMVDHLDFYFSSILRNCYKLTEPISSPFTQFMLRTGIDLHARKHGAFMSKLVQDRRKIEHNRAQIDRDLLNEMVKQHVNHVYKEGDTIQKNHIDVVLTYQVIREFAQDVEAELAKVMNKQNAV